MSRDENCSYRLCPVTLLRTAQRSEEFRFNCGSCPHLLMGGRAGYKCLSRLLSEARSWILRCNIGSLTLRWLTVLAGWRRGVVGLILQQDASDPHASQHRPTLCTMESRLPRLRATCKGPVNRNGDWGTCGRDIETVGCVFAHHDCSWTHIRTVECSSGGGRRR